MHLARVARFYGLNPFDLPLRQINYLAAAIPLLVAEEMQHAVAASRAANIDKASYERLIRSLQRMAAPYEELPPVVMATTPEQKRMAAEYLQAQGVRMA